MKQAFDAAGRMAAMGRCTVVGRTALSGRSRGQADSLPPFEAATGGGINGWPGGPTRPAATASRRYASTYSASRSDACAAASRATGTRGPEQET